MKTGLAVLLVFFPAALLAEELRQLDVHKNDDMFIVNADVFVDAPVRDVMAVLTNFDHLDWISGAIIDSRLLDNPGRGRYFVFVRTRACFGIFCREFDQVQRVTRESEHELLTETIPEFSDMKLNVTRWSVTPENQGTRLEWTTTVIPAFWVPPLIGDAMIRKGLSRQGARSAAGIEKLARERAARRG